MFWKFFFTSLDLDLGCERAGGCAPAPLAIKEYFWVFDAWNILNRATNGLLRYHEGRTGEP